jgi:signal transduction histidine kinase
VNRLSLRIYLAFVLALLLFFAMSSVLFWAFDDRDRHRGPMEGASRMAALLLPAAEAPPAELQAALERLAGAAEAGFAVFGADGQRLAEAGGFVPLPDLDEDDDHWVGGMRRGAGAVAIRLPDRRWLVVEVQRGPRDVSHLLALLGLFALALGIGAYPVARGITRRLERLSESVEALGAGDLGARAPVEGRDEVAHLATRFNETAERIEALVGSQQTLLASASHERRSPLARLRIAAEILSEGAELSPERLAELRAQLARDVAELDAGVEELLIVSRLDLVDATASHATVDMVALAAEEVARADGAAELQACDETPIPQVLGDARSLRHLLRNLIANAGRHAPGTPVEVQLRAAPEGPGVVLEVADRGPGIPPEDRERFFEAFTKGPAAQGGLGLGLAIVRQIARHHGGEVRALAREGGGTVLCVELPGMGCAGSGS